MIYAQINWYLIICIIWKKYFNEDIINKSKHMLTLNKMYMYIYTYIWQVSGHHKKQLIIFLLIYLLLNNGVLYLHNIFPYFGWTFCLNCHSLVAFWVLFIFILYVCASKFVYCMHTKPSKARRRHYISLEFELQIVISCNECLRVFIVAKRHLDHHNTAMH